MAGLIPQPFIDDLLNRTDIVELIDGYVPLKKRGNSHSACCPFHNEKNPSFNVVAKKHFYH
jgi:DNA primase